MFPVPPTTAPIKDTGKIPEATGITWTRADDKRQREARIAVSIKRAEARVAAPSAAVVSDHPPMAAAI
jgi:hypothetical protein